MTTFMDYIESEFCSDYTWTDDNMPDAFDDYLAELGDDEIVNRFHAFMEKYPEKVVAKELYTLLWL